MDHLSIVSVFMFFFLICVPQEAFEEYEKENTKIQAEIDLYNTQLNETKDNLFEDLAWAMNVWSV